MKLFIIAFGLFSVFADSASAGVLKMKLFNLPEEVPGQDRVVTREISENEIIKISITDVSPGGRSTGSVIVKDSAGKKLTKDDGFVYVSGPNCEFYFEDINDTNRAVKIDFFRTDIADSNGQVPVSDTITQTIESLIVLGFDKDHKSGVSDTVLNISVPRPKQLVKPTASPVVVGEQSPVSRSVKCKLFVRLHVPVHSPPLAPLNRLW